MKKILITVVALFMATTNLFAVDFNGEFQEVDGDISVIRKGTTDKIPATVGMKLSAGDQIETGGDAEAEVLYDDGNVTVIDENTNITITELSIGEDKDTTSILDLAIGTVKNSVTKIAGARVKFEVHTKSAVAGVTGTPPWVVTARLGDKGRIETSVDLLGTRGQSGGVSVRGLTGKGMGQIVMLRPATRTIIRQNFAPRKPFRIDIGRLNILTKKLPIKTTIEKRTEKREEHAKKVEKAAKVKKESKEKKSHEKSKSSKSPATNISTNAMMNHVVNNVSTATVASSAADTSGQTTETTTTGGTLPNQNVVTPTTTKVKLTVNIK